MRKFCYAWWCRIRLGLIAVVALLAVSAGIWQWRYEGITKTYDAAVERFYASTVKLGFSVRSMYLEGRSRTALKDVETAMGVQKGSPILGLSLEDIRLRLEAIPTVKHAAVERALPNTLYVRLVEREPVAIWQHGGNLSLIDDEGAVMRDLSLNDYQGLPLVVGQGAPKHVMEALTLLSSQENLKDQVSAIVRVGDRRWNMKLKDGVEVRLPEENAMAAWAKLAELAQTQDVLKRDVRAIDLRLEGRMVMTLGPSSIPSATKISAKET